MDLQERFLPGEEFLKEYPALKVDRRRGWSAFLTNRRLFIGSRNELWDIDTSRIDYLSRGLRPRFSPAWLLLCLFPWLGWLASPFLIALWYYIRTEALVVGTPSRRWLLFAEPEMLDDLVDNLRLNTVMALTPEGERAIVEAEVEKEKRHLVLGPDGEAADWGENESGPRRSGHFSLTVAWIAWYAGTFGGSAGFWVLLSLLWAAGSYWRWWNRRTRNRLAERPPKPGWLERGWYWSLRKLRMPVFPARWEFWALGRKWRAAEVGGWGAAGLLALGFLWALWIANLRPFLFLFALAVIVALAGKVAAGLPGPRWRIALRSVTAVVIGLLLVVPSLALTGLYEGASASLPHSAVQGDGGNGWVKVFQQTETMGLGLADIHITFYIDDAEDEHDEEDGYPAFLVLVAIKMPFDLEEANMLEILDQQFHEQAMEQRVNLTAQVLNGTRTTTQGYQTQYIIYNGTAEAWNEGVGALNYNLTQGAESRYIGEAWKVPELNLLVIAMGIAMVQGETVNDQNPDPVPLPEEMQELLDQGEEIVREVFPDSSDTHNSQNWIELFDMIPLTECYAL
ncbi:MAG: hypothetical protein QF378_02335 [Candidatus Poseidoniia archaeon]|nr:hypothetical protein [Candidatus Poseidoniia archaeon]